METSYAQYGLLIKDKSTSLPLKDVSVDAEIQGYVLGLKSTLKYVNDSTDPVEVMFRFPLEQSHAVVGLTAVIDGRRIKAQIKEKEQARAEYDDAIASGQSAALGEEKSGDVFSISLGNLAPGKEAEINLELVGELPIDAEGSERFSLPSTLKPRYTPAGSTDPLASVEGGGQAQVEQAQISGVQGFRLSVVNAKAIAEVTSPTHAIATTEDLSNDKLVVTLSESKAVDKDLVILIKMKDAHSPRASVEVGSQQSSTPGDFMSSPVVMVDFFPDIGQIEQPCEFIFLVDRSGSMRGEFIKSARDTLSLFLKSLPEECEFNIIGFGSQFEKLFDSSVAYSQDTLDKATGYTQGMDANLGGTELLTPLDHIFCEQPVTGFSRQVFVLTDGAVSNTEQCVSKVKENASNSRCFTFGIGSGASTALVEGLARAGNGTAEFVKEGERLQPKVIQSLKRALQPAVTDVSVEFKVPSDFTPSQSPQNLPPVFSGEKMVVYGILKSKDTTKSRVVSGTAVLKGKLLGKPIKHSVAFTFNPTSESSPLLAKVHHLAAKTLVKDWQNEHRSKDDIVKLSIESSVISFHTSFIAVDEENCEPISGAMKTWDVQVRNQKYRKLRNLPYVPSSSYNRYDQEAYKPASSTSEFHIHTFSNWLGCPTRSSSEVSGSSERASIVPSLRQESRHVYLGKRRLDKLEELKNDISDEEFLYSPSSPSYSHHRSRRSRSRDRSRSRSRSRDRSRRSRSRDRSRSRSRSHDRSRSHSRSRDRSRRSHSREYSILPYSTDLSLVISEQQANGSWKLDTQLARHLGITRKEIEDACPTDCKGDVTALWATVLVLSLLRMKYSSQQDEWELVGMKAESWVKKQTIPSGVALQDFYAAANNLMRLHP